jgi:hypothetical protein
VDTPSQPKGYEYNYAASGKYCFSPIEPFSLKIAIFTKNERVSILKVD